MVCGKEVKGKGLRRRRGRENNKKWKEVDKANRACGWCGFNRGSRYSRSVTKRNVGTLK